MAGNSVKLEFAGDAAKLAKASKDAEKSLSGFGSAATGASDDLAKAGKESDDYLTKTAKLGAGLEGMSGAVDDAGASVQALADFQSAGVQRAQRLARAANDVAQAMEDQQQAVRDASQALIDGDQASLWTWNRPSSTRLPLSATTTRPSGSTARTPRKHAGPDQPQASRDRRETGPGGQRSGDSDAGVDRRQGRDPQPGRRPARGQPSGPPGVGRSGEHDHAAADRPDGGGRPGHGRAVGLERGPARLAHDLDRPGHRRPDRHHRPAGQKLGLGKGEGRGGLDLDQEAAQGAWNFIKQIPGGSRPRSARSPASSPCRSGPMGVQLHRVRLEQHDRPAVLDDPAGCPASAATRSASRTSPGSTPAARCRVRSARNSSPFSPAARRSPDRAAGEA